MECTGRRNGLPVRDDDVAVAAGVARASHVARTLAVAMLTLSSGAAAQSTITAAADLLHAPNGRPVATLREGTTVDAGPTRSGFTEVTIEGWIASRLLGGPRDTFPASVTGSGVNLRASGTASSPVIADPREGMGVAVVRREGNWSFIRRTGWVRANAVRRAAVASTGAVAAPAGGDVAPTPGSDPDRATEPDSGLFLTTRDAVLREGPNTASRATIAPGTRVEATARERGWVRVRLEGWVRADALQPADTAMRSRLVPADLRADPQGTRGKVVHWQMQSLAFQTADPLQQNMAREEPYLLARGPREDQSLVYLAVPPSLVATARSLPPLSTIVVTARVRIGRSVPGGVPILDVLELTRR